MSTKKFKEIMNMPRKKVMYMIVEWKLSKNDFTKKQWKKFYEREN